MKLHKYFLYSGTAMFFIASTSLGKEIMPFLVILNPNFSNSFLTIMDYSALTLKSAAFNLVNT